MKRDQLLFLLAGIAFGLLFGYGLFNALATAPNPAESGATTAQGAVAGPQGPPAPGAPAGGGAPVMAEVNALKARLQTNPQDLVALSRLADLYYDAGLWQQAASYYERAVTLRPSDANFLTDLGISYRNLGDFERALAQFERAHQSDPKHWQSLFNTVVVAAFDLRRFDLAERAVAAIEAIDPRPAELSAARIEELRQAIRDAQTSAAGGRERVAS